jgi:hypothetical protein
MNEQHEEIEEFGTLNVKDPQDDVYQVEQEDKSTNIVLPQEEVISVDSIQNDCDDCDHLENQS